MHADRISKPTNVSSQSSAMAEKGEGMTRAEEIKMIKKFIKKNGVTKLAPDERLAMNSVSCWTKSKKTKKKKKSS
jgi:hypothetical protein